MDERLTDEHLREVIASHRDSHDEHKMATELLALRAKLSMIGNAMNEWKDHPVIRMITKEIARL